MKNKVDMTIDRSPAAAIHDRYILSASLGVQEAKEIIAEQIL